MSTHTILSPEELSKIWTELGQNDQLPDWYELTEDGELILRPKPTNRHQVICAEIAFHLRTKLGGQDVCEAAVLTTMAGVRVPNIVWMPEKKWQQVITHNDLIQAPDLVVEVLSPGNRQTEINHKVQAYLTSGIQEVILVGLTGSIEFHRQNGVHTTSQFNVTLSLPSHLYS